MKRSSGTRRQVAISFATASSTEALVLAEYCGYSGSTSSRVIPSASSARSTEVIDGLP